MTKMAYSFSRIKAFGCPFRFKRLYTDKGSEPAGELAEIGGAVHGLIARYRRTCIDRQVEQDPGWIDIAVKQAVSSKSETVAGKIRELMGKFKTGPMAVMDLSIPVNHIEEKWSFDKQWKLLPDWFDQKTRFRAIADFLTIQDRIISIIDDKTGWGQYDDLQLKVYAFCALQALQGENWPLEGVSLKFNLVDQRKVEDVGFYGIDETPAFREEIEGKIQEIEACKNWDPNPAAGACSYCGFHDECPALQKSWEVATRDKEPGFQIQTQEDAERAVSFYSLVERRLKELKTIIDEWVTDHGPVSAGGMIAEKRIKKDWKASSNEDILTALLQAGVENHVIDRNLSISQTTIKKILKDARRMDAIDHVLAAGEVKETVKPVGFYVAKDK
ncbi:MAG: PD-(D/E)XK nuclease family protein [Desulfobacteraceae bacterium]|nr:PD-(D/E)XK nuclease family protein [Desulfobacteraceae bacterium]MBL7217401.1 PD-(D/E)XK nuclease family protein [Desulfobacteraceae bacterium]